MKTYYTTAACGCGCPCCQSKQVGKIILYDDGTIEPRELFDSLGERPYQMLCAALRAYPHSFDAAQSIYSGHTADDRHAARVIAWRLRAKLRPYGLTIHNPTANKQNWRLGEL